jgi:ABC-2 type transport system ATP-binding protein
LDTVVEITNLTKRYGSNKALNNISFSVKKGEILGFLGPNGAGKSTAMNILTGFLSSDNGSAKVCGFDILTDPKEVKKRIGYLPEQPPIYLDMTVFEYLVFICDLKSVVDNRNEHIEKIMKTVAVNNVSGRLIKNLSKGYKQRVGLAGALIGDPEVLILDEPTVGLDPRQIIEIRNVIKDLGKDRTIILSTHILQEVSAVCDRVIIINRGQIVAEDTLENLSSHNISTEYTLRLVSDEEKVKQALPNYECSFLGKKEENTIDVIVKCETDSRLEIYNLLKESGIPILMFKTNDLTLEDIFIGATNNIAVHTEEHEEEKPKSFIEDIKKLFIKKEQTPIISNEAVKPVLKEQKAVTPTEIAEPTEQSEGEEE